LRGEVERLKLYKKGLFSFAKFKVGDKVVITADIYGNARYGAYADILALRKGSVGTIEEVDWHTPILSDRPSYFSYMFSPSVESWSPYSNGGGSDLEKLASIPPEFVRRPRYYSLRENDFKLVPEGYDCSALVECPVCKRQLDFAQLIRTGDVYRCPCGDHNYEFQVLTSPATRHEKELM
jgi:hypothetical protein